MILQSMNYNLSEMIHVLEINKKYFVAGLGHYISIYNLDLNEKEKGILAPQ